MRTPFSAVFVALITTGCMSAPPEPIPQPIPPPLNIRVAADIVETGSTHRTSRYVIESAVPARQVRDVLSSEMNVNIPPMPDATVGEGLGFLLKQTGYSIRPAMTYAESQLYQQVLPLVHMNMGYMSVRQALQVIGGDPWSLEEDVVTREVGFTLREGYVWKDPAVSTMSEENQIDQLFLSSKTPVDVSASGTAQSKPQPAVNYYVIPQGQSYLSALRQWLQNKDVKNVAWNLSPSTQAALEKTSVNGQTMTAASLHQVVFNLSKELGVPLTLSQHGDMSAVHSYPGLVDITWVSGDSLKSAIASVVKAFEWKWADEQWLAIDDYDFSTSYPVVTPKGDIADALGQVLDGYPVQAQLLYGTQQAFISEKQ